MKKNTYPKPDKSCNSYRACEDWNTWFRWHWNRFNVYAKKHGIKPTTKEVETND